MINYCDECQKVTPSDELKLIHKQKGGESHAMYVCPECYEKHEKDLELTRQNFQAQFGEKPIQESSKPATDDIHAYSYELHNDSKHVDIHKIIDDAMEKKDREVWIFINSAGTTVKVYPYEDKPREWILRTGNAVYPWVCPECGDTFKESSRHCPSCGEELRRPINY